MKIKEMTRKSIALFLVLALIISLCPITISRAVAPAEFKVSQVTGNKEDIITVNVELTDASSEAVAMTLNLDYDSNKLEFVSSEAGDAIQGTAATHNTGSAIRLAYAGRAGTIGNGIVLTVKFKIKKAASGISDLTLDVEEYVKPGEVTVDHSVVEQGKVTIYTPLESISLNKNNLNLAKGENEKLTVSYVPTDTTVDKTIKWESNNQAVATVDAGGNIVALAPGTAIIKAIVGEKTDTCTVNVTSPLTGISMNKTTLDLNRDQEETLSVIYHPTDTTDNKDVIWSSSKEDVATVDQNGHVIAIGKGNTVITAKVGEHKATCNVTVGVPLTSIELNKTATTLNKGEKETLNVKYNPTDTDANKDVIWASSDNNIATVTNGEITAVNGGTATIKAKVGTHEATCTVTVKVPLTGISIDSTAEITTGQNKQLVVTYQPEDTTDNKEVIWSSSKESIATVNSNGLVTAVAPGTAEITADVNGKTAKCTVTVLPIPLNTIAINKASTTIKKGNTEQLSVIYNPENTTDNKDVVWSSSKESIATVNSSGLVTAVAPGSTEITADVNGKTAKCTVTVISPLMSISLNKINVELEKGESETLTVSYHPVDTTDNKDVIWLSSNEKVATVKNGKIVAVAGGTTVITAKVGGFEAKCTVTVKVPMTGIKIKSKTELLLKQTETLNVTYLPEDTTEDRTVIWKSSKPEIVSVDNNGKITAFTEGTAVITAKVGTFEESCTVTSKAMPLNSIAIDQPNVTLLKGKEQWMTKSCCWNSKNLMS